MPDTPERTLSAYTAAACEQSAVRRSVPAPLGTSDSDVGINFALFSRHASRVRLELFDRPADASSARIIDLAPERHRTGDIWHVWIAGLRAGQLYSYRIDGPYLPAEGHRFNFNKLLRYPHATAIAPLCNSDFGPARGCNPAAPEQDLSLSALDNAGAMPTCVFTHEHFHWHDDRPLRHP